MRLPSGSECYDPLKLTNKSMKKLIRLHEVICKLKRRHQIIPLSLSQAELIYMISVLTLRRRERNGIVVVV